MVDTGPGDDVMRINLWSGPRNVSTATMYSFRQRSDTTVVDEPLYGHYLRVTGAEHPEAHEVMEAADTDGERVVRDFMLGPWDTPVVFFKNMGHHLVELDWRFLDHLVNVLLIRDPHDMLTSLIEQLPNPGLSQTGLDRQVKVYNHLAERGRRPAVLDSKELLTNPRGVLTQLCEMMGIPFEEAMLSWPSGPKPEDGNWAHIWYANAHASTGFAPYRPKDAAVPAHLADLLEEAVFLYDVLYEHAIKASG